MRVSSHARLADLECIERQEPWIASAERSETESTSRWDLLAHANAASAACSWDIDDWPTVDTRESMMLHDSFVEAGLSECVARIPMPDLHIARCATASGDTFSRMRECADDRSASSFGSLSSGSSVDAARPPRRLPSTTVDSDDARRIATFIPVGPQANAPAHQASTRVTAAPVDLREAQCKRERSMRIPRGHFAGVPDRTRANLNKAWTALTNTQREHVHRALKEMPRVDPQGSDIYGTKLAYARALHRHDSKLNFDALAFAACVRLDNIKRDPWINPPKLDDEQHEKLARATAAVKRFDACGDAYTNTRYARLLHQYDPTLDAQALSLGAGLMIGDIQRALKLRAR